MKEVNVMSGFNPQPLKNWSIELLIGAKPNYIIDIDPVPAPRMTRSDKWKKRPRVMRYFAFRNELILKANLINLKLPNVLNVLFVIKMPDSWTEKKRQQMRYKPHQQKPDRDNLLKSVQDAFNIDDAFVWDGRTTKIWGEVGQIIFY